MKNWKMKCFDPSTSYLLGLFSARLWDSLPQVWITWWEMKWSCSQILSSGHWFWILQFLVPNLRWPRLDFQRFWTPTAPIDLNRSVQHFWKLGHGDRKQKGRMTQWLGCLPGAQESQVQLHDLPQMSCGNLGKVLYRSPPCVKWYFPNSQGCCEDNIPILWYWGTI